MLITANTFPQNDSILHFEDYNPPSSLVVPGQIVKSSKYPFIDAHNHQFDMSLEKLEQVIAEMDQLNMAVETTLKTFFRFLCYPVISS